MTVFNQEHLRQFRFRELFVNDLGWDLPAQQQPFSVEVADVVWVLQVVAHKRGVQVLHCLPGEDGRLPDYATRQNIERKITPDVREHLIVFTDAAQTTQIWQWVSRQSGKTAQYREVHFRKGETPELLAQKLSRLHFALDEEELLTVLGVTQRLDDAAPREKVTKKFYNEFEKQRKAFAAFIDGIPGDSEDQRWYTAVVIDRLMFLWFLQEKGFLDGQRNYLQLRLEAHLAAGLPQSFYKRFLSPLFFRGFAQERTPEIQAAIAAEFGNVPYLNGGLFAQHELEQQYGEALDIADAAFQKLFAFFDEWEWHLDERPLKSGKEINPDVLGYIFEKFVNQKQMGAYYRKEDICEYIGTNTISPCLLSKVRAEHPGAFDALAWPLLQQSGDAYIYPAMLKGVEAPYPTEIANGLHTSAPDLLERRKPWNRRADDAVSLPTEIWRETIARHQRTRELRAKIAAGQLRDAGDLITWNLNIRQFAQDLIERCTDVALLKSFWFNLAGRLPRQSNEHFRHGLSVLDPTCGSGAFLFAALNILQPLYDATLRTLQAVRTDALITGETSRPEKWAEVDDILNRFNAAGSEHAQDYAVIKHIIVHNLYGVDIEKQATEIAKLRLFLKLVALLEPGDEIEPLPDIDFNIRHGNTLVGYATADETEQAVKGASQGNLFSDAWEDIRIRLTAVEQQYNNFQIQQVRHHGHVSAADKQALTETLHDLEEMLNYHLARDYGVNTTKTEDFEAWKASHQPFHWYVDFHPLMHAGGFDSIIGNPPYVELHKLKGYRPRSLNFQTAECGNLYAPMLERSLAIGRTGATWIGQIVPISCVSTARMQPLRDLWRSRVNTTWLSHYSGDAHPSVLFEGVKFRLTILLQHATSAPERITYTSPFQRWFPEARPALFDLISYVDVPGNLARNGLIPKLSRTGLSVLSQVARQPRVIALNVVEQNSHTAFAHRIVAHYVKAFDFAPYFRSDRDGEKRSEDYKPFGFSNRAELEAFTGLLNSSLFYLWFVAYSDVY
ncbi:MAG: Eco57I restriction-modification methylase domain-containing protein, partial [bacterium]